MFNIKHEKHNYTNVCLFLVSKDAVCLVMQNYPQDFFFCYVASQGYILKFYTVNILVLGELYL